MYTIYTGVSSLPVHYLGYENPDLGTFFTDTTSELLMRCVEEWRKMMVSNAISSLHPSNQPSLMRIMNLPHEEVSGVKPIYKGVDHVDFIGVDFKRKGSELNFI